MYFGDFNVDRFPFGIRHGQDQIHNSVIFKLVSQDGIIFQNRRITTRELETHTALVGRVAAVWTVLLQSRGELLFHRLYCIVGRAEQTKGLLASFDANISVVHEKKAMNIKKIEEAGKGIVSLYRSAPRILYVSTRNTVETECDTRRVHRSAMNHSTYS